MHVILMVSTSIGRERLQIKDAKLCVSTKTDKIITKKL